MADVHRLIASNSEWVESNDGLFKGTVEKQAPHTLWIGCADSRIQESIVTSSKPGEVFVHRNIANQFDPEDKNASAVLEYAVNHLQVEHVVVVGHTGCGGADACLVAARAPDLNLKESVVTIKSDPPQGALNRWLEPLTRLAASLELAGKNDVEALEMVVEANVHKQVENLAKSETIISAWKKKQNVYLHGWVYDLKTGKIKDLEIACPPQVD